jgi:hypothetical protein
MNLQTFELHYTVYLGSDSSCHKSEKYDEKSMLYSNLLVK